MIMMAYITELMCCSIQLSWAALNGSELPIAFAKLHSTSYVTLCSVFVITALIYHTDKHTKYQIKFTATCISCGSDRPLIDGPVLSLSVEKKFIY